MLVTDWKATILGTTLARGAVAYPIEDLPSLEGRRWLGVGTELRVTPPAHGTRVDAPFYAWLDLNGEFGPAADPEGLVTLPWSAVATIEDRPHLVYGATLGPPSPIID